MLELGAKLLRVAKNIKKGVPRRTKLVMALVQVAGRRWQVAGRDGSSYTPCRSEEHSDEESAFAEYWVQGTGHFSPLSFRGANDEEFASSRYSVLGTRYWVLTSLCKHLHIDMPTRT
jgi:hypothetical protein